MLTGPLLFVNFCVAHCPPTSQTACVKPSERILAYCAVILTLLALSIWLKFFQLQSRSLREPSSISGIQTEARPRPPVASSNDLRRGSGQQQSASTRNLAN